MIDVNERIATLGPVGVVLGSGDWDASLDAVGELERLGYSTIWVSGAQLTDLDRIGAVARRTQTIQVGTAILAVDQFPADAVLRVYSEFQAAYPGRVLLGIGGAHGPRPLRAIEEYLDRLDAGAVPVPAGARILSALGPRMLDLAGRRTVGALPVLATPEYTARARARLGPEARLVVQQFVVLDEDHERVRAEARRMLRFLRDVEGAYRRHFERMGFTGDDVAQLSDRLVDALVAWGGVDAVRVRVAEQYEAGADQVAVAAVPTTASPALSQWRSLARVLPVG